MIEPRRPQDRTFRGNIVQAMQSYASGNLGEVSIPLCNVDRIISIGSDRMMNAVKTARRTVLETSSGCTAQSHRIHQLSDAVHAERDLRAVFAAAC